MAIEEWTQSQKPNVISAMSVDNENEARVRKVMPG